jgi:hypothetical protein
MLSNILKGRVIPPTVRNRLRGKKAGGSWSVAWFSFHGGESISGCLAGGRRVWKLHDRAFDQDRLVVGLLTAASRRACA